MEVECCEIQAVRKRWCEGGCGEDENTVVKVREEDKGLEESDYKNLDGL